MKDNLKNFIVNDTQEKALCFFDIIIDEDERPNINFNFGCNTDPTSMDYETLGRIIATVRKYTISLYAMALENEGEYQTVIDNNIIVYHADTTIFPSFEVPEIDFKKYGKYHF